MINKYTKVRRIKTTQSTDRGTLFTAKNLPDGFVEFESLTEEGLFVLLDHDPNCTAIESQPIEVKKDSGKGNPYIPDAWARYKDGTEYIFDVKHHTFFNSIKKHPEKAKKWELRKKCVETYCGKNGLLYLIVTDEEIFSKRLDNIQIFRKNKKAPGLLPKVKPIIQSILKSKGRISRIDLAIEISKIIKMDVKQIIPSIDHLIYIDFFLLDFNTKIIDNTDLSLKGRSKSLLFPLYEHFLKLQKINIKNKKSIKLSLNTNEKEPDANSKSLRDFDALPEKIRLEIIRKIQMLKIFDSEDISTEDINEFARDNQFSKSSLYVWKNKYDQYGWTGLIPNFSKKGRKTKFKPEVEDLIQQIIEEEYLKNTQPSIAGCYRSLRYQCEKNNITLPSYDTFRLRIQDVSNTKVTLMRKGRKVLRDQYKSLNGQYPFGTHPLDIVEFDHTILDVMLVDRIDRKPIGRPVLTIAIDVYSRMIYGYYLSFDPPNTIAVGMAFLTGILPKDELTKRFKTTNPWPICGKPTKILLDNAKEFKSGALFDFCKRYWIQMISNPVKKPDTKPYVERLFRTINNAIRDDMIEGYILPLVEKRKTQYDPEKKAELTIEEFEKWLVHWIVDYYHKNVHMGFKNKEGSKINPFDRYEQGIAGANGITIGMPEMASNPDQLRYDLLPFKKRLLSRSGINMFAMEYNAPIISQLRNTQISHTQSYIVKYDPRDIREVYLWAESLDQYYNIPLKDVYFSDLKINPDDPSNYPLSLKELELIKKNRVAISKISLHELNESYGARKKMIEEGRYKTKTAKKARRIEEVRNVHKTKATSTQIRRDRKSTYMEAENENYDLMDEDDEVIAYPTEWEEVKKDMNLIYFDDEEEGGI